MGSLDGKVVLITGAAGGIGQATARHLHDEGAVVVATARGSDQVKSLADEFSSDRWTTRAVDVTKFWRRRTCRTGSAAALAAALPDAWVDRLAIVGTPERTRNQLSVPADRQAGGSALGTA